MGGWESERVGPITLAESKALATIFHRARSPQLSQNMARINIHKLRWQIASVGNSIIIL